MLYQGETLQLHWLDNGIAELVFNAPGSVNKLDTRTVASLGEALTVLEKQTELKGLLLRSTKAAFIVGADITEQTRFTMQAIEHTLKSAGATSAQLVRVNVFLLNMEDRDGFNAAYMEFFDGSPMPTRRLIGAGDLYKKILVEIDGIAWLGD